MGSGIEGPSAPQKLSIANPAKDAFASMEERHHRGMEECHLETEKRIKMLEASLEGNIAKYDATRFI